MEELQKISIKDFFVQVKNMAISPKDALKDMGDTGNYQSVAVPQLFISMGTVVVALLIAFLIGMSEYVSVKMVLKGWFRTAGYIMFYYILLSWGLSKLLWMLKDSMGFEGNQQKFNQILVLMFSAFFIGNGIYTLLTFIDALRGINIYLAPILGAAAAGYVLFMGFNADFEVAEDKKPVFVGIMVGVPLVAFILLHLVLM